MKYVESCYNVWEPFEVPTVVHGFAVKTDFYELHLDGRLRIEMGYPWDGPTGALNTEDFVKASCIHDIFCEMINAGQLPAYIQALADEEMRRIEKEQEMPKWRRMYTYFFVRFYQINKRDQPGREILEVP